MKNKSLISFRKEKNLSISDMAELIGISESYYEKIEYGNRSPSYNFLRKFKQTFPNANVDNIFLPNNHTICVKYIKE